MVDCTSSTSALRPARSASSAKSSGLAGFLPCLQSLTRCRLTPINRAVSLSLPVCSRAALSSCSSLDILAPNRVQTERPVWA